MLQTAEKVDERNGVICLVSMFPFWVVVLKFSEIFKVKCKIFRISKPFKELLVIVFIGFLRWFILKISAFKAEIRICCNDFSTTSNLYYYSFLYHEVEINLNTRKNNAAGGCAFMWNCLSFKVGANWLKSFSLYCYSKEDNSVEFFLCAYIVKTWFH